MNWQPTGRIPPDSLTSARLQLHYGAYVLGSTAHSVLPPVEDDSHTNLGFEPAFRSLATRDLPTSHRLHLDIETFTLVLRDGDRSVASRPLAGETVDGALAWIAVTLSRPVARREYPDFPASPLATDGAFAKPPAAELAELAAWFGNAQALFDSVSAPSRVWPHHFDLGALLPLSDDGAVSIGLGLSPGDGFFDQPYFYCSPYPAPDDASALPPLAVGHWTTDGFTSAIATATELAAAGAPGDAAARYLEDALHRCRELLQQP
ncbi:MAG: hypothetical protein KDE27_26435 [Planctomycetes bacterium]|nr:hypothetical protein [Planctomycetota bacterium]